MDGPEPLQADNAVELRQHAVQVSRDVVPGVPDVAGIQAHAHLLSQVHPVQNGPDLFKAAAHLAALARHGLQQHRGGLVRAEDGIEALGDEGDARLDPLAHMAAGVEVIELAGDVLQPHEVVRHGLLGEGAVFLLGPAEVQRVGGVGHDGGKAPLPKQRHQRRGVIRVQVLGPASPGIAGEKLKGIRPQLQSLAAHGRKAFGGGQVASDVQHKSLRCFFSRIPYLLPRCHRQMQHAALTPFPAPRCTPDTAPPPAAGRTAAPRGSGPGSPGRR